MKPDEVIQFGEIGVDKAAINRQLTENLQRHQIAIPDFPDYILPDLHRDENARFPPELYDLLTRLNEAYDQIDVEITPTGTGPWRGRLIETLKQPFQQLVIFYVNKLAAKQTAVNDNLRRMLHLLITQMENPHPRLAELEAEIRRLRARVSELEKKQNG